MVGSSEPSLAFFRTNMVLRSSGDGAVIFVLFRPSYSSSFSSSPLTFSSPRPASDFHGRFGDNDLDLAILGLLSAEPSRLRDRSFLQYTGDRRRTLALFLWEIRDRGDLGRDGNRGWRLEEEEDEEWLVGEGERLKGREDPEGERRL